MDCREIQEKLCACRDGELADDETRDIKRHLEQCGRCARLLGELRNVSEALRSLPRARAPEDFIRSVRARIAYEKDRAPARRRVRTRLFAYAASLAACAVIALAAAVLTGRTRDAARGRGLAAQNRPESVKKDLKPDTDSGSGKTFRSFTARGEYEEDAVESSNPALPECENPTFKTGPSDIEINGDKRKPEEIKGNLKKNYSESAEKINKQAEIHCTESAPGKRAADSKQLTDAFDDFYRRAKSLFRRADAPPCNPASPSEPEAWSAPGAAKAGRAREFAFRVSDPAGFIAGLEKKLDRAIKPAPAQASRTRKPETRTVVLRVKKDEYDALVLRLSKLRLKYARTLQAGLSAALEKAKTGESPGAKSREDAPSCIVRVRVVAVPE